MTLCFLLLATTVAAEQFPQPTLDQVRPAGINGALVICGGGKLPQAALDRFYQLAGGDTGRLGEGYRLVREMGGFLRFAALNQGHLETRVFLPL